MLRGQAVDIDSSTDRTGDGALDQAKARIRDIVVPVAVPILAGPGSITTTLLFGIRAEEWADRLLLGGLPVGVMVIVLVLLLLGHRIQDLVGPLVLLLTTSPRLAPSTTLAHFPKELGSVGRRRMTAERHLGGVVERQPGWGRQGGVVGSSPHESPDTRTAHRA